MTALRPIRVEIAPGELIDKITILEIKTARIADTEKRANVAMKLDILVDVRDSAIASSEELTKMSDRLRAINEQLWNIEDRIRDRERRADFGARFVELARDQRQTRHGKPRNQSATGLTTCGGEILPRLRRA